MAGADVPGAEHEAMSRPTTVVHLITTLSQGGAERVLSQVVPRPAEHPGERHVVVSLVAGGMFCDELVAAGVEVRDLGMRPGRDVVRGTLRLARMLRELRPDLVISWMYHASLLDMLARPFAAGAGRARMVWFLRGSLNSTTGLPLHTRMAIRVLAAFSGRPDAIAINSHAGKQQHEQSGYRPKAWIHLPNGCDFRVFAPDPLMRSSVRAELGIRDDEDLVLFVGRNHPEKGLDVLLDGLRQFDDIGTTRVALVLVGAGTQDLRVADGSVTRVLALGERRDVSRLLRGADVLVLPSRTEGTPNVVIEAMASEVLCLVTDVGDSARIVGDTGVVIPPQDAVALRDGLVKILANNPAERRSIGARARALVMRSPGTSTAHSGMQGLLRGSTSDRATRTLRIVHVIARMNVGGPARILAGLLSSLDPARFSQTLLTGAVGPGEQDWFLVRDTASPADPRIVHIEGLGRSISPLRDLRTLRHLRRTIAALEPDIVQTHTAKAGLLPARGAALRGPHHPHVPWAHAPRLLPGSGDCRLHRARTAPRAPERRPHRDR